MRGLIVFIYLALALPFLGIFFSCSHKTEAWDTLDKVENLMSQSPDSALVILSSIDKESLGNVEEKARYALLMSIALDKNYIDTTDLKVIQPAVDYYLKHGSINEKLRTLYYQGRVFQNMGDDGRAMTSFLSGSNLRGQATDTLILAHTLVAQGALYFKQYKIEDYTRNNLYAASLYGRIGNKGLELRSYARALDGYIMMGDKIRADSIFNICYTLDKHPDTNEDVLYSSLLSYFIEFGTNAEIRKIIDDFQSLELASDEALNIVQGYKKIGDYNKAESVLSKISVPSSILDSLKYLSVRIDILENECKYEQAFYLYKKYSVMLEHYHHKLFSEDILFAEQKYNIELDRLRQIQSRNRIIWGTICGIILSVFALVILWARFRISRSKHIIAEKENENLRLEQDKLRNEKEKAELERDNKILETENLEKEKLRLEAEQSQRELEAENLKYEKATIERECENLRNLLVEQSGLEKPIQEVIKTRLDMLNSLLAKEITQNDNYARPYRKWIESIREKKDEFMNSTRLAFTASHPDFIEYLESHNLTIEEINYLCLYAIGLRGKEVGEYIQLKRHYNLSSTIRKKLGITEHDTNIGLFIRRKMGELG